MDENVSLLYFHSSDLIKLYLEHRLVGNYITANRLILYTGINNTNTNNVIQTHLSSLEKTITGWIDILQTLWYIYGLVLYICNQLSRWLHNEIFWHILHDAAIYSIVNASAWVCFNSRKKNLLCGISATFSQSNMCLVIIILSELQVTNDISRSCPIDAMSLKIT